MDLGTRVPDRCVGDGLPIAWELKRSDETWNEGGSIRKRCRKG
jgi:hypothetical protein